MAGNDTAALVVALSAQLTKFEKDMKGAVDIADKRTKEIETRFSKMNAEISGKISSIAQNASGNIGFLGSLLMTLGPGGIAAAVGIGALAGAFIFLTDATGRFAEKAKALKEGAETIGLSITELKALGGLGKTVGLDFEETAAFFTQFILRLREMQSTSSGPLFDALLKVDQQLLRQLSTTKDSAVAIELLIKAYQKLESAGDKLQISRAAGGKGGLSGGRILDAAAAAGGLSGAAATVEIDEKQIERAAALTKEISKLKSQIDNIWGGMFSDAILQQQIKSLEVIRDISKYIGDIVGSVDHFLNAPIGQKSTGEDLSGLPRITVTPKPKSDATPTSPGVDLAILQRNLSLLEGIITPAEAWRRKKLEIAAAAEKGALAAGTEGRALAAFNVVQMASALATRERLAIATEQQIVEVRLAQLQQEKITKGLSEAEVERAKVVILREAKDAADALTVRRAYLPGLKQLELDAANSRKALDEFAVNSLNTFADSMTDAITKTKSLSDAFRDMANSIIRDLVRMSLKQTILGPLAGVLGGLGGGGTSFLPGASLLSGNPTGLAEGTDNWRGGPTWVGENGPEIVNLPRGAQVIPNDVARRSASGGVTVSPVFNVDASGADSAAIARLERALARTAASIKPLAVSAISEHASRAA